MAGIDFVLTGVATDATKDLSVVGFNAIMVYSYEMKVGETHAKFLTKTYPAEPCSRTCEVQRPWGHTLKPRNNPVDLLWILYYC
jgi:hypothetical protein